MDICDRYSLARAITTRLLAMLIVLLSMPTAGWSQACIKAIPRALVNAAEAYELSDGRFIVNSYQQPPQIYDTRISRFSPLPGKTPDGLQSVHRLEGRDFWVAYARDGIFRFDPLKDTFAILDGGSGDGGTYSHYKLEPDLWVVVQRRAGSWDARFSLLHADTGKITEVRDGELHAMFVAKGFVAMDNRRWAFTSGRAGHVIPWPTDGLDLRLLDVNAEQVRRSDASALPEARRDFLGSITALAKIDDAKWMLGTSEGLFWFDLPTLTLHLLKDETAVLAVSSSQPEWVVASENGLSRFEPGRQQISPIESAAMGMIHDVAEPRAGRLLIAAERGLFGLASASSPPAAVRGGTSIGSVTKLRSVGNERWLVEAGEGLYLFNTATDQLKALAETDHNIGEVQEYRDLGQGIALIRTDRLYRLDVAKETLEVLALGVSKVNSVFSGESNGYLLDTSKGWLVVDASFSNGRYLPPAPPSLRQSFKDLGQGRIIFEVSGASEQFVTFLDPSLCK